jgi:hypothetical protein
MSHINKFPIPPLPQPPSVNRPACRAKPGLLRCLQSAVTLPALMRKVPHAFEAAYPGKQLLV